MTRLHSGLPGCALCDRGWRSVAEAWVESSHPMPDEPTPPQIDDVESRRAAARNTVYPCKACRPEAFYAWAIPGVRAEPAIPRDRTQPEERF